MRAGRAVGDVPAGFPARHGASMDPEFVGQRGIGGGALLDIGARARRRGGVGVQPQMHQSVLPPIGLPRRDRFAKTLAQGGPQGPPARRAARLVAVAAAGYLPTALHHPRGTTCSRHSPRRNIWGHGLTCVDPASPSAYVLRRPRDYLADADTIYKKKGCRAASQLHQKRKPESLLDCW
jgi:hypothetical protein